MSSFFWAHKRDPTSLPLKSIMEPLKINVSGQIFIDLTKDLTPKCSKLEGKWDPGYFREIQVGEILLHLARWRYFGWEKSSFCKSDELSMFSLKNVVWWVVKLQIFLNVYPILGVSWSNLTSIFFRWGGKKKTPTRIYLLYLHFP